MSQGLIFGQGSWLARNRLTFLTLSLLGLLLLHPLFTGTWAGELVLALTTLGVAVFGIIAVSDTKTHVVVAVFLAIFAVGRHVVAALGPSDALGADDNLAAIPFFVYILFQMAKHLKSRALDHEMIAGAVSVYLLLGHTWAQFYLIMEQVSPGSFSRAGESVDPTELTYFSFVTLTTLGYGDISPVAPHARSFAIVEAISGVVFMGVFIGGMVGALAGKLGSKSD